MSAERMSAHAARLLPLLLLASAVALTACDTSPRQRGTRAGMAIALETRQAAAVMARAIANEPDPACATYDVRAPMILSVRWTVRGVGASGQLLALDERRHLALDERGHIRYRRNVDFVSAIGRAGQREREWRYIDGHIFTRDQNLPFERRQADVSERARLLDEVPQVFETLVRATEEGWDVRAEVDGFDLVAGPDGQIVRCGRGAEQDAWLEALLGRSRVVEADAQVRLDESGRTVERRGTWQLELLDAEPPARLDVTIAEVLDWQAAVDPVSAPPETLDTRRERLHHQLGRFLQQIDAIALDRRSGTGEGTR